MEKEYKNVGYFSIFLLLLIIAGFYKTYFGLFPSFDKTTTPLVHIHAFLLSVWVLLLIIQPILIKVRKAKLHKQIGKWTYILVPLIMLSFIAMMQKEYQEGVVQKMSTENLKQLFISLSEMILFAVFYILAIKNKRRIAYHTKYMIATGFVMISPGLARVFFEFNMSFFPAVLLSFVATDLIIVGLLLFDKVKRLNYKPYIVILFGFLTYHIVWFVLFY